MVIKPDIADSELVKIENTKEFDRLSKEIQELIKNYKDPDLTMSISNPETKTLLLPFVKKDESDLSKIKLTYFNTTEKKKKKKRRRFLLLRTFKKIWFYLGT